MVTFRPLLRVCVCVYIIFFRPILQYNAQQQQTQNHIQTTAMGHQASDRSLHFFGNATLDLECIDFNNCFDIEFICTKSIHANIDYEILLDILIRGEYFIRLE